MPRISCNKIPTSWSCAGAKCGAARVLRGAEGLRRSTREGLVRRVEWTRRQATASEHAVCARSARGTVHLHMHEQWTPTYIVAAVHTINERGTVIKCAMVKNFTLLKFYRDYNDCYQSQLWDIHTHEPTINGRSAVFDGIGSLIGLYGQFSRS